MTHTPHETVLSTSLHELQQDGMFCDFTIQCVDGSVPIHGAVAASFSDYFKAMLTVPMLESATKTVKLGMPLWIVKLIVEFFYSGKTSMNFSNFQEVFKAAHQLQIPGLLDLCTKMFEKYTTVENAGEVLRFSDYFRFPKLQSATLEFFENNIVGLTTQRTVIANLSFTMMFQLLGSDNLVVPNEDFLLITLVTWYTTDPKERCALAQHLAHLLRFPHMTLPAIANLTRIFGPIYLMEQVEKCGNWNLQTAVYRKRKYTETHCHFLWQKEDENGFRQLVLSCTNMHDPDTVVFEGPYSNSAPELYDCAVLGHQFYSCDGETKSTIVSYDTRKAESFAPSSCFDFTSLDMGDPPEIAGPQEIINLTISDDILYVLVSYPSCVRVFRLEDPSEFSLVAMQRGIRGDRLIVHDLVAYVAGPALFGLNFQTGKLDDIYADAPEDSNDPINWTDCTSAGRRDDVFYLYHSSPHDKLPDVLRTFDLTTRKWGTAIPDCGDDLRGRDVQMLTIRDDIYCVVREKSHKLGEAVVIKKMDEATRTWTDVQKFRQPSCRFLNVVPTDTFACQRQTWLGRQCQLFEPNERFTAQGVTLEVLRNLNL